MDFLDYGDREREERDVLLRTPISQRADPGAITMVEVGALEQDGVDLGRIQGSCSLVAGLSHQRVKPGRVQVGAKN